MSLEGVVDYGAFDPSFPTGSFSLIGGDAKHFVTHAVSPGITGSLYAVGCAEENAVIDSLSDAETTAHLLDRGIDPTGYSPACFVPCPGTRKWWALRFHEGTTPIQMAGVRYAINSSGDVDPDGVCHLKARQGTPIDAGPAHGGVPTANCWGAGVIGNYVHAVCSTGFGNPSFTFGSARIRLPLIGDLVDTNSGSALDHGAEVLSVFGEDHPFAWGSLGGTTTDERGGYFDKVSILDHGDGDPALLRYIGQPDTPAFWYRTPAGSIVDVTDQFPEVIADSGLNYAGVPGTEYDDVTAPSVLPNGEIVFGHTFSDNTSVVRAYIYIHNGGGSFTFVRQFDFTQNSETIVDVNLKSCQFFREPGSLELLSALADDSKKIYFGSIESLPPGEPEEDEPDPDSGGDGVCLFDWDECLLPPEHITVEIVSPSASPGRSLGGRKQVVQADAGCFRVVLHGVPVWSEEQLLTWREYESTLNGRVGACCVPLYEGKLSAVPIVATLGADAAVGVTRLTISQSAGATIRKGMHFQVGERAYRLISGSGTSWRVWPPLRNELTNGASLNFNDPRLRMRLARDDGMDIMLEHLRFGKPDVEFIEDV